MNRREEMNEGIRMQISAFVDGELPETEAQLLLRRLSQDSALRQQAAEYFSIGRAMRGETSIADTGDLRGRIAAALENRHVDEEFVDVEPARRRYLRPMAGLAIAASVATVAILGLQQMSATPGGADDAASPVVAEGAIDDSYTVPDLDYFERHSHFSSETGNNNFDFRRVNARMSSDGELEEIEPPATPVLEAEEQAGNRP